MPDALPLTGLFGKVPAHGDFVRRGLPTSFVGPWDSWLQEGMATARDRLGDRWAAAWDGAPPSTIGDACAIALSLPAMQWGTKSVGENDHRASSSSRSAAGGPVTATRTP